MNSDWPESDETKKMLINEIGDFSRNEIAPKAAYHDKTGEFPTEIIKKLGEMGLLGMMVDEKWGGAGMDAVSYVMAMEEVAAGCASTSVIMSVNNSLVCAPIQKWGSDEIRERLLRPLATGKKLGCFALSEPGHGSDPAGIELRAKKVKGGYSLKGTKNWITNGKEADVALVFAQTEPGTRHKGVIALLVEAGEGSYEVAKLEDKLGIKASSTAQLFFEDVFVPDRNVLAEPGQAFRLAMWTLDGGRIGIAAQAVGIARAAFDAATRFAVEREQFGASISKLQAIQFHISDMATRLQASRLLTWNAARTKDLGIPYTREAAMAKLFASESASFIANKSLQVHGGYGYTTEYLPERSLRDAKITEIYEGTSEIQRIVIAAQELKRL